MEKCNWELCEIHAKLKEKFYRTAIQPAILHNIEYGIVRKQHMHMMSVSKIRKLRLMYGNTRKDRIRIKDICKKVEVVLIEDKLGKRRLQWFEHMQDKPRELSI